MLGLTPPSFASLRFSCPHCGAFAHQHWSSLHLKPLDRDETPRRFDEEKLKTLREEQMLLRESERAGDIAILDEFLRSCSGEIFVSKQRNDPNSFHVYNADLSRCDSCGEVAIWLQEKLVYPATGPAGIASTDMPAKVRNLYNEASAVFQSSPKSSAALLRLALQHLLEALGQKGRDINTGINCLIEQGLDDEMAKAMHALRIVGNESVHPGVISVDDEPYIAEALFDLLNQIVDQMITRPKKRENLWQSLPEEKRKEVEKRLEKRRQSDEG